MESYMLHRFGMRALRRGAVGFGNQRACALLGLAHDAVFLFFLLEETHEAQYFPFLTATQRRFCTFCCDVRSLSISDGTASPFGRYT